MDLVGQVVRAADRRSRRRSARASRLRPPGERPRRRLACSRRRTRSTPRAPRPAAIPGSFRAWRIETFSTLARWLRKILRQLGHELVEALDRDEVFLKHVRRASARRRLELPDVVARLVVPPHDGMTAQPHGIDARWSGAPCRTAARRPRTASGDPTSPAAAAGCRWSATVTGRSVSRPRDRHHAIVARRIEVAVVEHRARRIAHGVEEELPVLRDGQRADCRARRARRRRGRASPRRSLRDRRSRRCAP